MKHLFFLLFFGVHSLLFSGKINATNYTWNGTTGTWSNAAKWLPSGVPGPADNVTIDAGIVTLDAAASINNLALTGGTLNGNFGMTIGGTFAWSGGAFGGSGTATIAQAISHTGGCTLSNGRILTLNGGGSSTSGSYILPFNNSQIVIPVGQTFTQTVNSGDQHWFSGSGGAGIFVVQGAFVKNGAGNLFLDEFKFNCTGTITVSQGSLYYSSAYTGANTFSSATITVASGGSFVFNGDGATNTFSNCNISGGGALELGGFSNTISSGNTITSGIRIVGSATINQNITPAFYVISGNGNVSGTGNTTISGHMTQSGGTINQNGNFSIGGTFSWTGGDFDGSGTTTVTGATAFLGSAGQVARLGTRTLILNGGGNFSRGELRLMSNALLQNATGSTLTFSPTSPNTANIVVQSGGGALQNNGILAKSGTGTSSIASAMTNYGTIKGDGTITFTGGFVQNASGIIAPGASLGILSSGSNLHLGSGTIQIEILDGAGPGVGHDQLALSGNVTLTNATLTVTELACIPNGTYSILIWTGARTGSFSALNLPSGHSVQYDDVLKKVVLTVNHIETCNGLDDDCDGLVDEGVQITFYADADGDGYGNVSISVLACSQPSGYVSNHADCNDSDAAIHPGATETCDNFDNDCNGLIDDVGPNAIDNIPPVITCPANQTVAANSNCGSSVGIRVLVSKTDNCTASSGITESQTPAAFTPLSGHNDVKTVTLTANDGHGNTSICSFTLTLKDVTPPTLICPADRTLNLNVNCQASLANYTSLAAISDNCTAASAIARVQSPGTGTVVSGAGITVVTLTATDAVGNLSACTFNVTRTDVILPSITCPTAQTLELGAGCTATLPNYANLATATDNCTASGDIVKTQVSPVPGSTVSNPGTTVVTLRATDASGRSKTCTFNVIRVDNTSPFCGPGPQAISVAREKAVEKCPKESAKDAQPVELEMFPNPTEGLVHLTLHHLHDVGQFMLLDAMGSVVWQQKLTPECSTLTIDLSEKGLASGLYLVSIRSAGITLTRRLVLSK